VDVSFDDHKLRLSSLPPIPGPRAIPAKPLQEFQKPCVNARRTTLRSAAHGHWKAITSMQTGIPATQEQ
jgi:hypothetical protein